LARRPSCWKTTTWTRTPPEN